jgi:hypothetical protein
MNQIIDILENRGLISSDKISEAAHNITAKEWDNLAADLRESLKPDLSIVAPDQDINPFNFLASTSLRGQAGCSSFRCRSRKIELVGRYAALFCDRVVLPLHIHTSATTDLPAVRRMFHVNINALVELRPLIEAGIIVPVLDHLHVCTSCRAGKDPVAENIKRAAEVLKELNRDRFSASKIFKDGHDTVVFQGPEEFLEHGQIFRSSNLPFALDECPYGPLPAELFEKTKFVDRIFDNITTDLTLQQIYGLRYNTKYLTDREGEAMVLAAANEDNQLAARSAALCASLAHRVPLLSDVPLEHILRIRREDYTNFLNYRIALQGIIGKYVQGKDSCTDAEARELFEDQLEPEIRKMEVQARTERQAILKKTGAKLLATFVGVFLGVNSGIVPHQLAGIIQAIGGVTVLGNVAESLAALNTPTVRNNNLYFLLRLKQEADS